MNNHYTRSILLATVLLCTISACRKKSDDPAPGSTAKEGMIKMEFFNKVGASPLRMDGTWYKNEYGDSFTVSTFNYYISNIRFNHPDGSSYAEPESYHLVKQSDGASQAFDISKIPAGTYSSVTFMIGVDSLHNVSGAQTGALDPANGMFWSWHTGYIMLKLEGTSPVTTTPGNMFELHAGGFSAPYSVLKTVTLQFPASFEVNGDEPHIHLDANVLELFKSPNILDLSHTPVIMSSGADAAGFADNYADMFSISAAGL